MNISVIGRYCTSVNNVDEDRDNKSKKMNGLKEIVGYRKVIFLLSKNLYHSNHLIETKILFIFRVRNHCLGLQWQYC